MMHQSSLFRLRAGHVSTFDVFLKGDLIIVMDPASRTIHRHEAKGLGTWMQKFPDTRLLHYLLPDGDRIIGAYSPTDENFGYAFNIDCDWCSEWGYLPVPTNQQSGAMNTSSVPATRV